MKKEEVYDLLHELKFVAVAKQRRCAPAHALQLLPSRAKPDKLLWQDYCLLLRLHLEDRRQRWLY